MLSYACTEKSGSFSLEFWPGDSGITGEILFSFPHNEKNTTILKKFEKSIDKFDFFAIINIAVSTVHLNKNIVVLCKGSTADSDSVCLGSNPSTTAKYFASGKPRQFFRGVAQFGRALRSGRRSRRFKSCHLDHRKA